MLDLLFHRIAAFVKGLVVMTSTMCLHVLFLVLHCRLVRSSLGTRPFLTTWKGSGDTRIIELSRSPEILGKPQLLRHHVMFKDLLHRHVVACCARLIKDESLSWLWSKHEQRKRKKA